MAEAGDNGQPPIRAGGSLREDAAGTAAPGDVCEQE